MDAMTKSVTDGVESMQRRFPDAPETIEACLAFFKSGLMGFRREEAIRMLHGIKPGNASEEQLRVAGDAAIVLGEKEQDRRFLSEIFGRLPDLERRLQMWWFLSKDATIEFRKDLVHDIVAASARGPEEQALVALRAAEWDFAFGSRRQEEYERLLGEAAARHPGTAAGQLAATRLAVRRLQPGQEVPAFAAEDVAGAPVSSAALRGNYVVLWFWAEWWPAFTRDLEAIRAFAARQDGKPVTVVAVSIQESPDPAKEQVEVPGIRVDGTRGSGRQLAETFDVVRGTSRTCRILLIDPEGKLVAAGIEGRELEGALEKTAARTGSKPRIIRR
jgi:peroxiredoxin